MPLYEYVCQKCERRTEVIQNVGERRIRICPHCGGKVKKAFSSPAIHFKGSGFHITDYAKGKKEEKSPSPSSSEKSDAGKSQSGDKPAEKSAEKPSEKKKESKESTEKKAAKD
jgi:putative FmdB family regulatory protein